jgi:hypothetical protein
VSPDVRRGADRNDDPTQTAVAGDDALEEHPRGLDASPRTRRSILVAATAAFDAVAVRSVGAAAPAAAASGSTVEAGRPAAATAVTTIR